jgi:shikimate kinase / 3-dehydroquinate synthase
LVGALNRHLALVGFMGAGKTTVGREVARLTGRPFVDLDEELERRHGPIARIFEERGEPEFRVLEAQLAAEVLGADEPAVVALGGGAVTAEEIRGFLDLRAFTVWLQVSPDEAWARVGSSNRPLARDEGDFRRLHEERQALYEAVAEGAAEDVDGVLLAGLEVELWPGGLTAFLDENPGVTVIGDEHVLALHLPGIAAHTVPAGEGAKTLEVAERLWTELPGGRETTVAAVGGGSITDLAGFVAAAYMRGVPWVALPTTLTGQVDAAIGGKTGIDLPGGKNLVGAFHFPYTVVLDPEVLATLPPEERRAGMAEVVKTGLLAGRQVWELPEEETIRACAAYKAAVVLSDPYETEGRRTVLNLGHTFAHALEAASDYALPHGEAVALGLLAALRLSGLDTGVVEEILQPRSVRVDADTAWNALRRDKKGEGVFVLLEEPGRPQVTTLSDADARRALESLIAK